jgi:DNA repair exonuclease SbcCD ATPase subunit
VNTTIGTMLVEAFASWRELEVDFDRRGLVLVNGPTGSGKSSLFQALFWSLNGEAYKNVNLDRLVNHRLGKNCCVKTYVNRLSIERYRKHSTHGNTTRLFRGATEMTCPGDVRDTQRRFERMTGLNKDAFLGLSYVDGHGAMPFLEATPGQRAKALDRMFGLDELVKCAAYARQQAGQQAAKTQALMGEVAYQYRQLTAEVEAARQRSTATAAERGRLERGLSDLRQTLGDVQRAAAQARAELQDIDRGLTRLDSEVRRKLEEAKRHRDTRLRLKSLVGEECSYCLRPFAADDLPPLDAKLAADVTALEAWASGQRPRLDEQRALREAVRGREAGLETERRRLLALDAQGRARLEQLREVDTQARVRQIQDDVSRLRAETVPLRRSEAYYRFWAERFGPDGMRADFLAEMAGVLSQRLSEYASYFSGLDMGGRLEKGVLTVEAAMDGGGEEYQEMSTGERTLAQVVMSMALRDLTALRYPGAACNVLLFDEVMGTIDPGRMEETVNFLNSLLTGTVNTVMCISHRAELREYFPQVWQVRKPKNEFSELVI